MLVAKLVSAVEEEMELPEGSMGCMPTEQTDHIGIDRRHELSLTITVRSVNEGLSNKPQVRFRARIRL